MLRVIGTPLLVGAVLLAGCESPYSQDRGGARQTAVDAPAPQKLFRSEQYGVELAYPENGVQGFDGATGYFDNHGWRVGAGADETGQRLLALRLDGSNTVTTGELRLGVSRAPRQLKTCTQPGNGLRPDSAGQTTLGGVRFTTFKGGDAGMSHYQKVHAYRAEYKGTCYAIDLVVEGVNPRVYDPPRQPPFSGKQAFQQLHALLAGFAFTGKH